jgi:TrmH family RNA methyltransferase
MLSKQTIKDIQTLGQKKFRQQEGLFIAEGPKLVKELLEDDTSMVKEIFALKEWIVDHEKIAGKTTITEITETELDRISQLATPNKVLAIARQFDEEIEIKTKGKIILALDGIQDPGNMGTIIRTADWFGIEQIVCSHDSAEVYNPKVVQATMGSIARVKVLYTDLQEWLAEQKDISIYATTLEGENVSTIKKIKEGIIIFGNESKGISPGILELATVKLTIPRKGKAESLNAAVAAGVVLGYLV